ncbi:MAG: HEPN domain-containing protein [Planctomycetes bacterium]|nr:HEPN domain-containing protein [Planctomycetota bacterium]MBU4399090.1 HEPN domain-containing protein [Planctomycetota bacterium]MCG2683102.1 HEPN domain-containing protein [Planctomycetales bacterium]
MKRSLPRRSKHQAERLREITQVIRELVGDDLAMLILFGSYARGDWVEDRYVEGHITYTYQSDFDLLVVTEKRSSATARAEARLVDAIDHRLQRLRLDKPTSNVIVEDIKNLNKDLQRGSYFLTDIKKEGVLLFDNGRHTLAKRCKLDPKQRRKYAREDYNHWFKSASEFLDTTFDDAAKRRYKKAAFELHQATERFFTATILVFSRYKPKTHDIKKLDRLVSNLHADFFTVFPRATPEQKHLFDLLKRAYIDARYKRDFKITKTELEYLATRVRKLQTLTKKVCRKKIASMEVETGKLKRGRSESAG